MPKMDGYHIFKELKDKKFKGYSELISNPEYIHVYPGEINRRWVKWFAQTSYGKKNWKNELKAVLSGKDNLY